MVPCHGTLDAAPSHNAIDISHPGADFKLTIAKAGAYALFCEHHPLEFGLHLAGQRPAAERKFASHHHEDDISSIGISDPRALDPVKVNQWFDYLLKTRGQDIFRMKGVLNVKGEDRRQVFPRRAHDVRCAGGAALGRHAAREQPGVHRPWTRSRRARSRLRIRRREVIMAAKKSLSFALEPRATASIDDYVADCVWAPDSKSFAIAGGEGKVALARADADALDDRSARRTPC